MSVRVMSLVWQINLPDSQKIVLLALADCANDEGTCWPSIATLAAKCSKSERTVQGVIRELVESGHLTRIEKPGKGCIYTIHPRNNCTPAAAAPPQPLPPTPAAAAPKPSRTIIGEEAKASPPKRAPARNDADSFVRPEWAEPAVWRDFLTNRKRKRLPNTATAYRGFLADIARLASDEWPPGRLLEHAVMKGWGAIYAPDEMKEQANGRTVRNGSPPAKPALIDIGRQVAAELEARSLAAIGRH